MYLVYLSPLTGHIADNPRVQPPRRIKPPSLAAEPKGKSASKLAKHLGLDADEESEIQQAWEVFADAEVSEDVGESVIPTKAVRRAMM